MNLAIVLAPAYAQRALRALGDALDDVSDHVEGQRLRLFP